MHFLGLTYRSPENLEILLSHLVPLARARGTSEGTAKVKFKYYPEDVSRISVFDPVLDDYLDLTCTDQEHTRGLSEAQLIRINQFADKNGLARETEDERCVAKARFQRTIREMMPAGGIQDRNRAARLLGDAPDIAPGNTVAFALSDKTGLRPGAIPIDTISNRKDGGAPARAPKRRSKPTSGRKIGAPSPQGDVTDDKGRSGAPPVADLSYLEKALATARSAAPPKAELK